MSGYAPLTRPLDFSALEISWETSGYEFELFGIDIKALAAAGKRLIFRCGRCVCAHVQKGGPEEKCRLSH